MATSHDQYEQRNTHGLNIWSLFTEAIYETRTLTIVIVVSVACSILNCIHEYPLILPGGFVASPISWLTTLLHFALVAFFGALAPTLAEHTSMPLAYAACACAPAAIVLTGCLWCAPAFILVACFSAACGLLLWACWFRFERRGIASSACTVVTVFALSIFALCPVGESLCTRYPDLFAAGYAMEFRQGGHDPYADTARDLYKTIEKVDGTRECEGVIVSPFAAKVEGKYLSWAKTSDDAEVIMVTSEFLDGSTSKEELAEHVTEMVQSPTDKAFLYSHWLDGILWMMVYGYR